jgi:hypothetical protein
MSNTPSVLSGQLFYFFVLTLLVTVIGSALMVWHYGRRVLAGMREREAAPLPLPAWAPREHTGAAASAQPWLDFDAQFERRLLRAWGLSALLAALPVAAVYLRASDNLHRSSQWMLVASVLALLAVPVTAVSRGWQWQRGLKVLAGAMACGALATLALSLVDRLASGRLPTWDQAMNLWFWLQFAAVSLALPLALLVLSSPRRVRLAVPLVFGALTLFALAPFFGNLGFQWVTQQPGANGWLLAWGGTDFRHIVFAVLALPAGWLAARRLRALSTAHAAKRVSDAQLSARAWWLMGVGSLVIGLTSDRSVTLWSAALCGVAGLALGPVQRAVFARLQPAREAPPPRTLLFLRAFGYQARTERLFDRLGARWRALGPITMIAAPDVVARSIDPGDLLAWLQGREGEAFVRTAAELQQRLAAIDTERDPDGRFRITEFCCVDSTWQATVVSLMARADAVLMDLRGVKGGKLGCAFELEQLALRLPGRRVVLVIDGDTHIEPLRAALGPAADAVVWQRMDGERPADHEALFGALVTAAA